MKQVSKLLSLLFVLLLVSCEGELIVNNGSGSGIYDLNTMILIKADRPITEQRFYKWEGSDRIEDPFSSSTNISIMRKLTEISALYSGIDEKYNIEVIKGYGGGSYFPGELITITADEPSSPNFAFQKWIGDISSIKNINLKSQTFRVSKNDQSYEAIFKEGFTVDVKSGTGDGLYFENDIVTIKSDLPKPGEAFKEWIGDTYILADTTNSIQNFKMTAETISLEATYQQGYKVSINKGSGSNTYLPGDMVTIVSNTPPAGYMFDSWSGDTTYLTNTNLSKQSFKMPYANVTLTANFRELPEDRSAHFNLLFTQSIQKSGCSGCGIWFDWQHKQSDKAKLVIEYTDRGVGKSLTIQHGLNNMENGFSYFLAPTGGGEKHSMLIKKTPNRVGLFYADLGAIPISAIINKATLYLHIETHEGLAYGDYESSISVYECTKLWNWNSANWNYYDAGKRWDSAGGDRGEYIREISAKNDLFGAGFSKARPHAFFDFTSYAKKVHQNRN